MTNLVPLQQASRGTQFRAHRLHATESMPLDPFMGVDHAWMNAPTFPPHPHAGFSAVTYLFPDSATGISNRDSLGTVNLIEPGGLHWTAAGRGVIHEEIPAVSGRTTHLLQIFINLPKERQLSPPQALSLSPNDVPVLERLGVRVRVPLGSFEDVRSPLQPPTPVTLLDITLTADSSIAVPVPAGQKAFFIPINGICEMDSEPFGMEAPNAIVLPVADKFMSHRLFARNGLAQVAVFIGEPLRQPVFSNGPMAFASQEDLMRAVDAYRQGEMGRL